MYGFTNMFIMKNYNCYLICWRLIYLTKEVYLLYITHEILEMDKDDKKFGFQKLFLLHRSYNHFLEFLYSM